MQTFCTIITKSHLPFAKVLYQSLQAAGPGTSLQVLVVDDRGGNSDGNFTARTIDELKTDPFFTNIERKYAHTNTDHFRWALKPVFLLYLLKDFEKVIYVDADVFFTGPFGFLFAELDKYNLLLSPQWGETDPLKEEDSLYTVLRNGLFSACFVGATPGGRQTLEWWAEVCHYKMDKAKELGLYDDQKYLDLFPLLEEKCGLIRHRGCNLTNININSCKREIINGKLVINGQYEPVFIHFMEDTVYNIEEGNDPLLQPFLSDYKTALQAAGATKQAGNNEIPQSFFHRSKRKLMIRTRVKRFFFKLAEKL